MLGHHGFGSQRCQAPGPLLFKLGHSGQPITTQFYPQVFKTSDGDKSVPITWAYNHHYGAYLSGGYSKMTQLDAESGGAYPFGHQNHGSPAFWLVLPDEDVDDPRPTSDVPISQFFSEGNGGEFRWIVP